MPDDPKKPSLSPRAVDNPLPGGEDHLPKEYQRKSHELLYESIMHSGGEPFGNTLGMGTTTLTQRTVRRFRKKSFFFISTYETFKNRRRNPFTRAGAQTNQHDYPSEVLEWIRDPSKRPKKKWYTKVLDFLLVRVD